MILRTLALTVFLYLGLAFIINTNPANAQTNTCKPFDFNLAPVYQTGSNTISQTSDDFNGEGNIDIAVVNAEFATVSVLLSDAVGGFGPRQTFPTELNPWSITSGDLNSDGKIDLIVGSFYENKLAVLLNDGQGGFLAPNIITPPNSFGQFIELRAADFNDDGNTDVVALASQENKQLFFFLGDGLGNLTLTSTLTLGGRNSVMEVGNLNGDNIPDIITSSYDGFIGSSSVQIVFGKQSGVFIVDQSFSISEKAVGISIADLNNNGTNDIAMSFEDQSTPTTHWLQPLFNNGDGTFVAGNRIDLLYFLAPSGIAVGDFNGDGKQDLAALLSNSLLMVTYGTGNGNYQNPSYWAVLSGSNSILPDDLNHDGKADLIVFQNLSSLNNSVSVLINNNNGFIGPQPSIWGTTNIEAADFNNDGYKDFISAYVTPFNQTSEVVIALNDRNQGLLPDLNFSTPAALSAIRTGDFNGDGNKDAITSHSFNSKQIDVYLGNGTGAVGEPISTSLNVGFENIIVGDFNSDGKDDVFAVEYNARGYSFLSNGDGTFTLAPNFPVALQNSLLKLEKGDFNRDNKLDLIISDNTTVNLWLGDGTGQFTLSTNSIPSLDGVVVGDYNGDGKLDLAGFADGGVKGVLGDGNGGFGESFSSPFSGNGKSLITADFNLDGFDDLAFRDEAANSNTLVIIPSGGQNPSWLSPLIYSIGGLTGPLIAADYNADNKPDIGYSGGISRGIIYNTSGDKPCLSINDVRITEGDSGTTSAGFTVSLSAPASQPVQVNYSLEGSTATVGTDLQNVSGRLEIPAGHSSAT
ncbi:MAG: VCBS repeat-containing protein, partial [Pyrinomonadaceae bacterium]